MLRLTVPALVLSAALVFGPEGAAQQVSYGLEFDLEPGGCSSGYGNCAVFESEVPGGLFTRTIACVLGTAENTTGQGAQGWSIGLSAENLKIVRITTEGTVGGYWRRAPGLRRDDGFEHSEITSSAPFLPDNDGAISAVTLSSLNPDRYQLPLDFSGPIAKIDVEGSFPGRGESTTARLYYVDGLRGNDGNPVVNRVTHQLRSRTPALGECTLCLSTANPCPNQDSDLQLIWQAAPVVPPPHETEELLAGMAPTPDPKLPAHLEAPPGHLTVYAAIVSQLPGPGGVQGWGLSVGVQGSAVLVDANTRGTVADYSPQGLRDSRSYESTEIVDPERVIPPATHPQGQGATSAVVLKTNGPLTLQPTGTATVLELTLLGRPGDHAKLSFKDGLVGSGLPVRNIATVNTVSLHFACMQSLEVQFTSSSSPRFVRGDSNADGKLDISDAAFTLGFLFLGTRTPTCRKAADANDDGNVDISDPVFTLSFLFLGGPRPGAPNAACGLDPTPDAQTCEAFLPCQ